MTAPVEMPVPDIIGRIPDQEATFDSEGNLMTPVIWKEGFHVNFMVDVPEIAQYKVTSFKHYRVYAGGVDPVCYRFPDEATFRTFFPLPEVEDAE